MEPASAGTAASQAEPYWWWDYAPLRAPDHEELYYFKWTVYSVMYFFLMHYIIHLVTKRKAPIYAEMTSIN